MQGLGSGYEEFLLVLEPSEMIIFGCNGLQLKGVEHLTCWGLQRPS